MGFRCLSFVVSASLLAGLVTIVAASTPEAQPSYQMLVNFGAGWRESAVFDTLEACKRDAAAFAKKYVIQAGCAETTALERWRADESYQQRAARCAELAEAGIGRKPNPWFTIFGTARDHYAFDTCMTQHRPPTR